MTTTGLGRMVCAAAIVAVLTANGCSSGRVEQGRLDMPARATASANPQASDPQARTIRPSPDVITRAKPFRLPDVIGAVPSLEPVTMQPLVNEQATLALRKPARPATDAAPLEMPAVESPRRLDARADSPAVAEVAAMMRDYLRAFNQHDAAALAAHWSESGENVDLDSGETTRGRAAVEEVFSTLFAEDASAAIDIDIESIRPLRDEVAVVDGVTRISFSDDGAPQQGREAGSRFSAVVVKHDGRWMIESVRETAAPTVVRPRHGLDELDWLVGSWEDIGEGVTAGTQCFWSAGKAFLVRTHAVTFDAPAAGRTVAGDGSIPGLLSPEAGKSREITEIIGWDPERGQVRSWLFTSDGRFAEGFWTREGDRWVVRLEGRGADESALCTLAVERVGSDEVVVRCEGDALVHLMPPACGFVRTARLAAPAP
ncbi:MAG: SgcJ/EcaC family oxidoreductase [Planctomycetia bacterium]